MRDLREASLYVYRACREAAEPISAKTNLQICSRSAAKLLSARPQGQFLRLGLLREPAEVQRTPPSEPHGAAG